MINPISDKTRRRSAKRFVWESDTGRQDRGGGYNYSDRYFRPSARSGIDLPTVRFYTLGFRIVRNIP